MRMLLAALVFTAAASSLVPVQASQQIVSAVSGKCLANPRGSMDPAVRLIAAACNGNPNQLWEFHADGRIVNKKSGLCIGVPKGKKKSGSGVFQAKCGAGPHRLWSVDFIGDVTITLSNQMSGLCLDTEQKPGKKRPKAIQATCSGAAGQQWLVTAAPQSESSAATPKQEFDPAEPARELIAVSHANLSAQSIADLEEHFSKDRLDRLFSADFIGFYKRAADTPQARHMGRPLDYDVVINAQDGCPLENVTIDIKQEFQHSWDVIAHFQSKVCWGDKTYTKVVFIVVEENGRLVVDDIFTYNGPSGDSVKIALDQLVLNQ